MNKNCPACGLRIAEAKLEEHLADHAKSCKWCGMGMPVLALDRNGVLCSITERPGIWSHASDDDYWPCERMAHLTVSPSTEPPERKFSSPTLAPLEVLCRRIGNLIGDACDSYQAADRTRPRIGFTLLMFTFGKGGWMTYISNAQREDMIQTMKEFTEKSKAQ